METFVATLKEFGPFTLPICILMGWVIRWLLSDRERLLTKIEALQKDQNDLRDKRTDDQKAASKELLETSKAVTHSMNEWAERVDKVTGGKG